MQFSSFKVKGRDAPIFKNVILFHLPPKWDIGLLRWYPRGFSCTYYMLAAHVAMLPR